MLTRIGKAEVLLRDACSSIDELEALATLMNTISSMNKCLTDLEQHAEECFQDCPDKRAQEWRWVLKKIRETQESLK